MNDTPTVSVAIATCNGERFIEAQVASILAQRLPVHELVVCDDASDDATVAIVERMAAASKVPLTLVRHSERLGVFRNFLCAFEHCSGSHIAYCDQDDVWSVGRLEQMVPLLRRADCALAFHQSAVSNADLSVVFETAPPGLPAGAYDRPLPGGRLWGFGHQMIFRRDVAALVRLLSALAVDPQPDFFRNFDRLLLIAAGMLGRVYFLNAPLVQFRRHANTVSDAGAARQAAPRPRLEQQHDGLHAQLQSLRDWRAALEQTANATRVDAFLVDAGAPTRVAAYVDSLRSSERRLCGRMAVYERTSAVAGVAALVHSVALGNYGSVHRGRLPARILLADAAAALAPLRLRAS